MNGDKTSKRYVIVIATFSVLLILVLGYFFIAQSAEGLHDEKVAYLQEISLKSAASVKGQIDGYFSTLEAITTIVGGEKTFETDYAMHILCKEADKRFFKRMGLILPDGTANTTDGFVVKFSEREYFKEAMNGNNTASDCLIDILDGEEISVFASPINHDGGVVGVVFATQTQEKFSEMLEIESFSGDGYSYIIKSDGRPIVKTSHKGSIGAYDNLFETLLQRGLSKQKIDELKNGIDLGYTGSLECRRDGVERYLCYAPVGINDWYIISVVPSSVISRQSDRLIGNLSLLVGLFVLIAIIICYKTIRFFQKNNEHLTYIAYNDAVTGYTNWEKFRIDAEKILEDNDDEHFAIVVFDINKFKVINDMFGYKTGNDILKFLSDLISLSLGKHEIFCRNSADNFNILLRYESDAEILRRIDAIAAKLEGYIANYKIKISAGIYVITETSFDVSALCDKANISRTIAKKPNQYNNYQFFRDENRLEILHEKEIENAMDAALADGEFAMYLQPKYLSSDDSIIGAEALVRWNRSGVGLMCPGEFIPLFERNGFIRKLDMYMLDEACQLLARWQNDFPLREQITISVNISRVNLWGCTLAEDMLAIVHKYGIAPNLIEIELTESAVFENTAEMKEIMHRIKEAGFMLSIDDFGSGYSSLASLKYLPADFVKMDKSFLDEAEDDKLGKKIIRNMIHMIKSLGMKTIAEGVETQSQLDFLKTAGCDIVQGYFWAKPMPVSDFEQLMIDRECVKIL